VDGLIPRPKAHDHGGGKLRELGTCPTEHLDGHGISGIGRLNDKRAECGKVRRWNGVGPTYQCVRIDAPRVQNQSVEVRDVTPIDGTQNMRDGSAANPLSGAFVGDGVAITAGADFAALSIATPGDGTGTGNNNDPRTVAESCRESDPMIANYQHIAGNNGSNGLF
jgi:hypothetical protein